MATVFCEQENGWHIWQDTYDYGRYHVVRPDHRIVSGFETDSLEEAESKMKELMAAENEPDGAVAAAFGVIEQTWPHTMDAQVWAAKWMETIKENPSIATDEGAMLGWFANAIMAGYDTAQMRQSQENK